jgi:hypothetical protein
MEVAVEDGFAALSRTSERDPPFFPKCSIDFTPFSVRIIAVIIRGRS